MHRFILGIVLAFLLIFPSLNRPYLNTFLIILFMYITLCQSYDMLAGYTGYINLGHIAFFGIGAYTFGILWNKELPLLLSFLSGLLAAAMFAVLISLPFFRLRGAYFSLASFGLVKLMEHLALNLKSLTLGSDGLKVIGGERMIPMYYLSLFLVVAVIGATYLITRSRLGLAMASIREEEEVASDFGVPVQKVKTTAMAISAAFAGLIGALYTWYIIFINPSMVFGTDIALMPIAMAMLGGSGVILGPIVGAIFLFIVEETLWIQLPYLHTAAYGLVIIFVGLFMPGGLVRLSPIRRTLIRLNLYHEL